MTRPADKADKPSRRARTPRGRPTKVMADTVESAELVEFLQQVRGRLSVRELAERFGPYGKTKWAEYLNGTDLIPPHTLEQLVCTLITEPRLQEVELKRGKELLDKAERAAAGKPSPYEMALPERELHRRLEQTQQGQIRAQQAFIQMTHLAFGLVRVVESLRRKCADLEASQEASRGQITSYTRRLHTAEENLEQARHNQEEAERLRLEAVQRAERYRLALEDKAPQPSTDTPTTELVTPGPQEPTLDDYDTALEDSAERLDETNRAFDDLRRELDLDPPENEETPSSGQPKIVRGQLADNEASPPEADPSASTSPWFADPFHATTMGAPSAAEKPPPDDLRRRLSDFQQGLRQGRAAAAKITHPGPPVKPHVAAKLDDENSWLDDDKPVPGYKPPTPTRDIRDIRVWPPQQ